MDVLCHTPGRVFCAVLLDGTPQRGFTTATQVPPATVTDRVRFAADLVTAAAAQGIAAHWNAKSFDVFAAPKAPDGADWLSWGFKAARQCGWTTSPPTGTVFVSSRVTYMANEQMMRALRAAVARAKVVDAVTATWFGPDTPDAERDRLLAQRRALLPHTSGVWVRNTVRCVAKYVKEHGRLPASLFELEEPTVPGSVLSLPGGADVQFAKVHPPHTAGRMNLDVLLPTCAAPASKEDWCWHRLEVGFRNCFVDPFTLPTLRVTGDTIHVDLVARERVSTPVLPNAANVLEPLCTASFDWGVRRILTGTITDSHTGADGVLYIDTVGVSIFIDAGPLISKWHRLRVERERLRSKADHIEALCAGTIKAGSHPDPVLVAKIVSLRADADTVTARQKHLGTQIANLVARLAVEHAAAAGAHQIAVEDLASLEPPKHAGKRVRTNISQQLRSQVFAGIESNAARAGIVFVEVPAWRTSSHCAACEGPLEHAASPDGDAGSGYAWARCVPCGRHSDRDVAGSDHVGVKAAVSAHSRLGRTKAPKKSVGSQPNTAKRRAKRSPSARVRLGRSDRRIPAPSEKVASRSGPAIAHLRRAVIHPNSRSHTISHISRQAPCGPVTPAPTEVGTPFAGAGHPVAGSHETAAVPGTSVTHRAGRPPLRPEVHNVGTPVTPCDGLRYAHRTCLSATPVPKTPKVRTPE